MTLLHHEALVEAIDRTDLKSRLVIMPMLDRNVQIGSASVDLRLGTDFRVLRRTDESGLDPGSHPQRASEAMQQSLSVDIGKPLWLHPNQFLLGSTLEFLRLPADMGAYVLGRSSWGRVGLLVATAIMVQPGYSGNLTLELVNHGDSPIALYPGSRIAQLAVHSLSNETKHPYGGDRGKYVAPTGPEVSQLSKEHAEIEHLRTVGERLESPSG